MPFGLSLSMMFNTARMENMKEAVKEVKEVKKRKPSLDLLPNDILVDLVFNYLNIQDVLAMRRVRHILRCTCFSLTHTCRSASSTIISRNSPSYGSAF